MDSPPPDPRRTTPRTDAVLSDPRLAAGQRRLGRALVRHHARAVLEDCRAGRVTPEEVVPVLLRRLPAAATSLHPVVNATGVVVHTNLGRAPLSEAAREAVAAAAGHCDVELDLDSGRRGRRGAAALDALTARVPDAEAVHVVNNNAAAVALAACALGAGREVVIARGEMVEIGDGFRIPELVKSVGARLREVGTTNRVRFSDYADAVGPETGCVLKVHPSNFTVTGFTSSVPLSDLAGLSVPLVADLGSGLLAPHPRLPEEPSAAAALRAGADLVTASGDKLLGGPQCGLLLGTEPLVQRLRRHPLARAMRVDKLTLAALEATLTGPPPPVPEALDGDRERLRSRAAALVAELSDVVEATVVDTEAAVGGGGAPGVRLPSVALALDDRWARPLRTGADPVLGRVERDRLLLDLFTVPPDQDGAVADAVRAAAKQTEPPQAPGQSRQDQPRQAPSEPPDPSGD